MNDNITNEAIESILRFLDDDLSEAKTEIDSPIYSLDAIGVDKDRWIIGYIEVVKASINTINILKNRWKDKGLL